MYGPARFPYAQCMCVTGIISAGGTERPQLSPLPVDLGFPRAVSQAAPPTIELLGIISVIGSFRRLSDIKGWVVRIEIDVPHPVGMP